VEEYKNKLQDTRGVPTTFNHLHDLKPCFAFLVIRVAESEVKYPTPTSTFPKFPTPTA